MDYKEYLDKARIKQLAELQARYNQVYAKERAEAASSLIAGHRQLRRGLQNVGLAGRKGNLISGREKTAALEARRRYREYNAGLSRAANTFTTAAGQRMARQAIDDENRVKRAEAYAKWGDEYAAAKAEAEQEYAAKLEEAKQEHLQYAQEYQNSYNAFLAQQAQYQAWLQQQAAAQAAQQELIDPRFQGNNMQQAKQDLMAARAEQQRLQMQQMAQNGVDPRQNAAFNTQQGKVNYVSALAAARQQAVENELRNNDIDPRFAQNSMMQQTKPQASAIAASRRQEAVQAQYEQNLNEWREKIQRAEGITKPKTRNEYDKWHEAQVARQQMIDYERRVAALKYPAISNLITLSDSEFAMRYDAAEKAYKQAVQNAQILRKDSSSSMDDLSSDANDIEAKATVEFVKWQNAARARDDAMGAFYNESVNTNMKLVPHAPTWASEKDHDGKNYTAAMQNHWDATQYARSHDTDGSKYMPLVNEWSFINGRTALNYTQTHAVSNFVNNAASGGKKTQQYNAFVANCAAAFYNQPEGLTKNEREKMEAMLTLANLMTDEERARFNTILRQGGGKEADKYFEYLYASVLPQRFDSYVNNEMKFQTRDGIGKVFESVMSIPVNLAQGVSGVIHTLSTGQEDPIAAKLAATKYNLAQGARDAVGQGISSSITNALMNAGTAEDFAQWAGSAGNFLYGTGMSMADSATVAAISAGIGSVFQGAGLAAETASKIGSAIGGSLLGASAFNSSYQEALNNGLDPQKARITAIGNGLNEMIFETLSIGTLLEVTGKETIKVGKSAFMNWLVNTAVQAGVEGSEEVFTDIGNKIWDNRINGIFSEEMQKIREYVASGMSFNEAKEKVRREFAEQLGMSFLGGAISGGFMGGGAQFVNMISNRQLEEYGKTLSQEHIDELKKYEYKSEQAQEILNSDKITNTDAAILDIIHTQELVQESINYVEQAVAEGKMPQEIADIYKKFAEHNVQTETNPDGITDEEAEKMLPYVDVIKNAEAIKQGLGKIVEQQNAARKEFDALSSEQKQQRLQTITNETTALRNAPSLRVGASESRLSGQSAAQEFTTRAKTDTITLNNDGSVKTANGSVTFDFGANKTVDAMTDNQARAIRFAAAVANKTGVNIKVEQEFVGADRNKNGEYNPETNTIRVNLSGTNSAIYTMSHELTHYLQENNKQAFADLSKAIQKQLSRTDLVGSDLPADYQDIIGDYLTGDNTLFEALCAYEKERYAKEKINLTQEKVEEEVIARCCESFLGNSSIIADMTQNHTKSARAVYRFLNEIRADINALRADASERMAERGYASDFSPEQGMLEQFADIDKIVKLWENGLRKVAKKNKASGEKLYSLQEVEPVQPKSNKWQRTIDTAEAKRRFPTLWDVTADESEVRNPTQIKSTVSTYRKIYNMLKAEGFDGTILDASSGLGYGTKAGQEEYGFNVDDIEPYPDASYKPKYTDYSKLNKKYDVIISNAVLNVIPQDQRDALVVKMGKMLNDGGRIFINTRSKDVDTLASNKRNTKIGNMEWFVADTGSYQKGFTPNELQAYVQDALGDGFTVERSNKFGAAAVIVTKKSTMASLSDTEYLDLAKRYESGDKSVESELRKAVDAAANMAGYKYHLYRGGGSVHNVFDTKRGKGETQYGQGTYFTDGKGLAEEWALDRAHDGEDGYVGEYYVRIGTLFDDTNIDTSTRQWKKVESILKQYGASDRQINIAKEWGFSGIQRVLDSLGKAESKTIFGKGVDETNAILQNAGYDGIKGEFYDSMQYVIFDPTQAKSADLITKDDNGNIIPLSERFKTDRTGEDAWKNEDIRYSIGVNDEVITNKSGDPVMKVTDNGNSTMLSLSTYEKDGRATLKDWLKKQQSKKRISKEDAQYIIDQMEKVYDIATKYENKYAAFGAWSRAEVTRDKFGKPVFSVIRANGEYPMNLDFSLVCVKRRALDAVLNEIVKSGYMDKLVLDGEALVKVNETIRRHGFETACMGCFVEAKRFRQQDVAKTFVGKYNDLVKSLGRDDVSHFNFAKDETIADSEGIVNVPDKELDFTRINELVNQYKAKKKANPRAGQTVEEAIAMELKMNPSSRRLVDVGDFMSTRGMDAVAKDAPSVLTLYNKQKGTGGPKAVFGDMQYLNDVERRYQWTPEKAYKVGGVRVQSFSDFVPRMFFDYCQMVADLSAKKLPAHAYTKEESFVKLFGLTGMKINMSLFPKIANDGLAAGLMYKRSADGDIVFENGEPVITYAWAGESFDYETAKQIQADAKYGKNCGTIAVGISDEHIARMLDDPTIRMIIPYHKSSLNPVVAEMMGIDGFTNYTEQQRTRKDGNAIDVDFAFNQRLHEVGDPKAVAKEYLAWCEKNGYTPKFEQFKDNENYYKLLEDFALYDEQGNYCAQEAVKMVYPEQGDAFGSMDTLLDEYLKRDNDLQEARDAMVPMLAQEIIRQTDKKASLAVPDATLAGQMHEGAKGARALREQAERYNERIDELNGRIGKLNKRIADLKAQIDEVSLAERMHQGAEDAATLRKVRDEYNERIAQRDRLLEQVRKQRDAAKQHAVEVRKQERAARVRRDIVAVLKRGNDRIVKLLANPTENSHVPVQLAQAVSEYAQRLNELLTTSVPKSGEFAGMEKQTQKGALNAQKIIDALNRSYADEETIAALKAEDPSFDPRGLLPVQYDENGNIVKDETLVKMINGMDSIIQGKHLTDLTEDELRFVLNTMRGVIHTVTDANKVTVQGEQRNVYRTSRQMANEVNSATKVFGDKSNKITKFLNRYVIESLGLRRIAKLYSGSNENAVFVKMVDDLNEGALELERIKQTLRGMFNEVTNRYAKEMDTWYGKNAEWIDTGFGFKITKGMRVSLAMHILNAQNLRNVEKAGLRIPNMNAYRKGNIKEAYKNGKVVRLTKAQAQQIVDNMTEAEKAYFEVAKEFFHKRSGFYINRTSLKLLGYSKAVVENYFPIQTDDAYRTVKYDDVRQTASVEHPGFLESRKGTANVMYLNDITAVVNRQIDGVAKYAGLAIPIRNWNNIMNAWLFEENEDGEWVRSDDGRAHDVLERRMGYTGNGKAIIDYVDQFITDLTSPGVRDANEKVQAAEFAAKLTSNYVKAVLTLNARVALSQLASVPTAASEIPWKYIAESFGGNVEGHLNRNASNDLIDQYTPIFAMRRAGTQTEVSEVMKRRGFADKAEQKLPGLLGWITAMDVAATRRLWYACERWVKGETNIPVGSDAFYKEVAKRYERVIQNTQPNFTVLQRSPVLRSKNAAARLITMFGTQRMQNGGIIIESAAEVVQAKDAATRKSALKRFGRALSGQITAAIVLGLSRAIVAAVRGRMRPLQDDDKDITVGSVSKYIMNEIGTSIAGSFMYVGEIYDFVSGVVGGIVDGDSGYETSFALPAAESLSTIIQFFKEKNWQYFEYMSGDHTDNEKWLKTRSFVNTLMTVASYATGLPLANASKTILNGAVPLVQDIVESTKTGELNLYLHQSGKLDSAKTAENYKEWTNLGKKGSVYLAWENRFKEDTSDGLAHRAELLFEDRELSADEKAILLRMSNSTKDNPLASKDGVVYKADGTVAVDFTTLDRYRASTMLSDKQYEGFLNLVDMGVAEDVASTAFIQYNVQKKQGSGANDRFRDWLFTTVKNPEDRAKVDMAVVGNTVRVDGTIGYKENGELYADYSSKEMFDLYTNGKKQEKSDAIISTTETPEAKAKAFADTDNNYHAKGGIVYNDKDKVVADFTSDEAYRASQMGESHYEKYNDAVKYGMSRENAILAVEKHKEFTDDDDKDNATQYATWVFNTYKNAKDRAVAGAIYTTKPVTVKDGKTYDENGYIYRDYTSAAWYKLSNRTLSKDGVNKRYEAAKLLEKDGYTAEKTVAAYVELDKLSKKTEWQKWLKDNGYTNDQIKIILWSRGWAKMG